jgi:RsiW-degrading membrane proteinase PrsW (M82 family)
VKGYWILFLLLFIAALPVFLAFLWYRRRGIPSLWFLLALAAGVLSLLVAAAVQSLLPFPGAGGPAALLFGVFIRVALVEELSRLVTLAPLLRWGRSREAPGGALTGLAAGLGFAAVESAFYGAADISVALLRAVTAAPLHGACGAQAGAAAELLTGAPGPAPRLKAAARIASALVIHGLYDLIIAAPGLPALLSAFIALAALASALAALRGR